jgi:hypothetical protein
MMLFGSSLDKERTADVLPFLKTEIVPDQLVHLPNRNVATDVRYVEPVPETVRVRIYDFERASPDIPKICQISDANQILTSSHVVRESFTKLGTLNERDSESNKQLRK